jgi:hypothetical protein
MYKAFFAGVLVGSVVTYTVDVCTRRNLTTGKPRRRKNMTAEEKVIARAHELVAERPDVTTPDREFLRDWAYGNAGLEDEKITVEQVETVLRERSA